MNPAAARKETQFKKSMDLVKDAVPESLEMDGQSPLTLLHSALSEGMHAHSDEDCLNRAHVVRMVLAEPKALWSRLESQTESGAEAVNAKLLTYLRGWLQHHILVVDKAYQPLVEDNQAAREAASRFKPSHHWWGR